MNSTYMVDWLNFLPNAAFLVFLVLLLLWGRSQSKNRTIHSANTPILLAYYSHGIRLTPMRQGKIGNLPYTAILASGSTTMQQSSADPALLFRVELPYASSLHLLGIPKTPGADQINPADGSGIMEKVELEGDYSTYFTLYCEKGMQTASRYALDPKAMIFTIEFCTSQSWEIVGNELYFVQESDTRATNDPTLMFDDIETFVKEIRPAIEQKLTHEQLRNSTPYGKDRRTNLPCPICTKTLTNNDDYYACQDGHGYLLTGSSLGKVKKGDIILEHMQPVPTERPLGKLRCPSCGHSMNHVNYTGGETVIDSCPNCVYRWLDSGELQ